MKQRMGSSSVFMAEGHRDVWLAWVRGWPTIADTDVACAIYRGRANRFGFVSKARRFRCRNLQCERKVFAEQLSEVAAPRARETTRLRDIVGLIGYAMGGLPGSRLLSRLGMPSSDDTVLRRVKAGRRGSEETKVRVLGVDDWAWRKQQRYGTMLMDLEQQQVIDLLAVRSADSFADWLGKHPEVELIARDRSGLCADGGRQGVPAAAQITDRYHLMVNLSEAVEQDIQQLQGKAWAALAEQASTEKRKKRKKLTWIEARRLRCRQARYERYLAVVELGRQGYTQLAIAGGWGSERRLWRAGCVLSPSRSARFAATGAAIKPDSCRINNAACIRLSCARTIHRVGLRPC